MDEPMRIELEAAAFRGLVDRLRRRTDVQNIDLMNLAGFCRNCLAKWLQAAAEARGVAMTYDQACDAVYGMPAAEWKRQHQTAATAEQLDRFAATKPLHAKISGH